MASPTFYFYDLETSGFNPRQARVMQFAGQRVGYDLKPTGQSHNYFIKITPDVLPDPGAVLTTGITPQQTIQKGITEFEFLEIFYREIATPDTVFVGYNTVRFDDEFLRFMHYRNFYDPYEWSWKDGRSRWDLLDMVRMMRALRPDGVNWPFTSDGRAANTLALLAELNNLKHTDAHDAMSDVGATVELARLIKLKQPKLFDYLLNLRDKKKVKALVERRRPFIYTSGRYGADTEKTAVVKMFASSPGPEDAALVFDLRFKPKDLLKHSPSDIAAGWQAKPDERRFPVPVKTIKYNRCPAVAPINVLDPSSRERLKIDVSTIKKNELVLDNNREELTNTVYESINLLRKKRQEKLFDTEADVDGRLYDGFFPAADKMNMAKVRRTDPLEISQSLAKFKDERLNMLLPLYKARNFPDQLSDAEKTRWRVYCRNKLAGKGGAGGLNVYLKRLEEGLAKPDLDKRTRHLLEELKHYAETLKTKQA